MSIYGQFARNHTTTAHPEDNIAELSSSSSEEEQLTVKKVIEDKPPTKVVREFFKQNLAGIKSEEEELFDR